MTDAKQQDTSIVTLANVRLAFPVLHEAKAVQGGDDPAFSATFLLDPEKNSSVINKVKEITKKVAVAKWGTKADAMLRTLEATGKLPLKDGNLKEAYGGFAGNMYISARSKVKPEVRDMDGKTPLGIADGRPYAGCYVYASISIWAQDNSYGKRINATLRGVQFFRDGDAFAGGTPVTDSEFADLSDTGEAAPETGSSYA